MDKDANNMCNNAILLLRSALTYAEAQVQSYEKHPHPVDDSGSVRLRRAGHWYNETPFDNAPPCFQCWSPPSNAKDVCVWPSPPTDGCLFMVVPYPRLRLGEDESIQF